jgi:hypothetical protein
MEAATPRPVTAKSTTSGPCSTVRFAPDESTRLARADPPSRFGVRVPPSLSEPAVYVTIPLAASLTGYSAKAIRRKIESGVWVEGREIRRAPDGHVLVSMKGYRQWVERGRA